jgi:hypothetical protein
LGLREEGVGRRGDKDGGWEDVGRTDWIRAFAFCIEGVRVKAALKPPVGRGC